MKKAIAAYMRSVLSFTAASLEAQTSPSCWIPHYLSASPQPEQRSDANCDPRPTCPTASSMPESSDVYASEAGFCCPLRQYGAGCPRREAETPAPCGTGVPQVAIRQQAVR